MADRLNKFISSEGRTLAAYQARQAQQARPAAMVTQVRPAPSGAAFGKKRS